MMADTLLARVVADRADTHLLVRAPDGMLDVGAARALGPAPDLTRDTVVLVCIGAVLPLAQTLLALDGHVDGLLLVSANAAPDIVRALAATAGAGVIVSDRSDLPGRRTPDTVVAPAVTGGATNGSVPTRWMMTTSGTTGTPKIVPHSLNSLARTVRRDPILQRPVWGMVYDMTRFAGLQVGLQSLLGGGVLAAPDRAAPLAAQIDFLARAGVTHLSATPTLWRRLLMVPGIERLPLRQVTMGGEIADQAVLDAVSGRFPDARLTHIYASTEAGVGFAVNDRRAGFPMAFLDTPPGNVGVAIRDGLLWVRPPDARVVRYLGGQTVETDADGYVNTGDRIETRDGRAYFLGRDSGVVNVGGVKVYPERVERIILGVPGVALAAVSAKANPITGALLVASVVPADPAADQGALRDAILAACRSGLEREATPARIRFIETLDLNAAGKIIRN